MKRSGEFVQKKMVVHVDNPNFLFPFVKWAQEVYQNITVLRTYKSLSNNSGTGSYCVLTNIGKKTDEPVTVYVKIKRTGLNLAAFEIYDTVIKKYIFFQANNEIFDFNHRAIDDKMIKSVSNYGETPYNHDHVLESSVGVISSPNPQSQSPQPVPTQAKTNSSALSTNTPEIESDVLLLKHELERSTCENIILTIEKEALMRKLMVPRPEGQFDILKYNVIRHLTYSIGIRNYTVEHIDTRQIYNLKEYIIDRYSPHEFKLSLQTELSLLTELNTKPTKSKHICYLMGKGEDLTIIRQSHYLLTEPASLNLEEFSLIYMKQDKSLATVIITQVLEGLDFLDKAVGRIHGNLDTRSIVIDSNWTVKLTSFGKAYKLRSVLDPIALLNGENDLLMKHPYIFEQIEQRKPITVQFSIDRWSIGCLYYRLLFDADLFLTSPTVKTHPNLIMQLSERPFGKIIAAFLNDYRNPITPGQVLEVEFLNRFRNQSIGAYLQKSNNK